MDFISETQEQQHRHADTLTGKTTSTTVSRQTATVTAEGARGLTASKTSITTIDGVTLPAETLDVAYCRTCHKGPFSLAGVATCWCGSITCRQCGKATDGVWRCRRHYWRYQLTLLARWLWRVA